MIKVYDSRRHDIEITGMMKNLDLNAPQVEGIFFGLIVATVLFFAPTPSGFALAAGIISGVIAFFVLD